MLTRFDPFKDVDRLLEDVNLMTRSNRTMPLDIARGHDRYVVEADLPGVSPDSIELSVEGNVLTIRAERASSPSSDLEILSSERPRGTFTRQLTIGKGFDMEGVTADYQDGVLTVTLPVAEAAKPRKIAINTAKRDAISTGST